MAIHIRDSADPLSEQSRRSVNSSIVLQASSAAARIFQQELERYCAGQITGRSFLVSGHRGAGKTAMVAAAIDAVLRLSRFDETRSLALPLPVFLHGPSLFANSEPGNSPAPAAAPARTAGKAAPTGSDKAGGPAEGKTKSSDPPPAEQAKAALVHIILGLHRATVQEFVYAYREQLTKRSDAVVSGMRNRQKTPDEWMELAAQFEIEIHENPPAYRLYDFWKLAGFLESGALFARQRKPDQGFRELVALNGMCNAHQRISGEISSKDQFGKTAAEENTKTSGSDFKTLELVKPLTSITAGAVVTAGGAMSGELLKSSLLGLLTAVLASTFFKSSSTTTEKHSRQIDITFIPDLSQKTLDRILPTLLERLRNAGMAPVLIIDELDKVKGLPAKLEGMVYFLKKLVAENVFTCFLTDRSYSEHLRVTGRNTAYSMAYSYFSHPLLVSFEPHEFHDYLNQLLKPDQLPAPADPTTLTPESADELDQHVLVWVLRHRSQLHALALAREVAAIRLSNNTVGIQQGHVLSSYVYRIDVTFQVAIEFQLMAEHIIGWRRQRPEMLQAIHDALYYLSRQWITGEDIIRLDDEGKRRFADYLCHRMNLDEVEGKPSPTLGTTRSGQAATPAPLTEEDQTLLFTLVRGIVTFLSETNTKALANKMWKDACKALGNTSEKSWLKTPVLNSMLLGANTSLLYADPAGSTTQFRWRYFSSGINRLHADAPPEVAAPIRQALEAVDSINGHENMLKDLLAPASHMPADTHVFYLLSQKLRVLPTSPAWSVVSKAISNLDLANKGQGNRTSLPDDCRAVMDFEKLLKDGAALLYRLLVHSALLGGMHPNANLSLAQTLHAAMEPISSGLQFHKLDPTEIWEAFDGLDRELEVELLQEPGWEALLESLKNKELLSIEKTDIHDFLTSTRNTGTRLLEVFQRQDGARRLRQAAWDSMRARVLALYRGVAVPPAQLDELICAMQRSGPFEFLGLDPTQRTLVQWTTAWLRSLLASGKKLDATEPPPRWLIWFALNRLGASNLSHSLQSALKSTVVSWLEKSSAAATPAASVEAPVFWEGNGTAQKFGLMICRDTASVADRWTETPKTGLLLILNSKDWEAYSEILGPILRDMQGALSLLAFEETTFVHQEKIVSALTTSAGSQATAPSSPPVVYVYATRQPDMAQPLVYDPQGPDDILNMATTQPSDAVAANAALKKAP